MTSARRHRGDVFDFCTAAVRLRQDLAEPRDLGPQVVVLSLERVEPENLFV
jgi:hypothetical protein